MSLANDIHDIMISRNYHWKIGGELKTPTTADVSEALDKIKDRLDAEPVGTSIEVGRLRVQKTDDGLELYIYLGDIQ